MAKITKISKKGLDIIKRFEGFSSTPYLCPAGVPTIGWGSTRYSDGRKVKMTDPPLSKEEGERLLISTLASFERDVDAFCRDDINQNQFDALVSFAYNCGSAALKGSTLLKKVNINPKDPTIKDAFIAWKYSGGKPLLLNRRLLEWELYNG